MSTRAVIARPHPEDRNRWSGIYLHGDGYPTHTGKHLYAHVVTHFKGDAAAAAEHFIDHHPAGWSFLAEAFGQSECYCHDRGEGKELTAFEDESGASDMDWTYVLRPEGLEVHRWDRGVAALVPWDADRTDWEAIERHGQELSAA